jgi:hypothetical protein
LYPLQNSHWDVISQCNSINKKWDF